MAIVEPGILRVSPNLADRNNVMAPLGNVATYLFRALFSGLLLLLLGMLDLTEFSL